jgi:hypothetical protein
MGGVRKAAEVNRSTIAGNLNGDQTHIRTPPANATPVNKKLLTRTRQGVFTLSGRGVDPCTMLAL